MDKAMPSFFLNDEQDAKEIALSEIRQLKLDELGLINRAFAQSPPLKLPALIQNWDDQIGLLKYCNKRGFLSQPMYHHLLNRIVLRKNELYK